MIDDDISDALCIYSICLLCSSSSSSLGFLCWPCLGFSWWTGHTLREVEEVG